MTEAREIGALPTGVVTFLFTDVEGSTALWAADSTAMAASLAMHDEILRVVVAERRASTQLHGLFPRRPVSES